MTADPKPDATPIDLVEKLLSDEPMTRTEAAAEITRLRAELAEAKESAKSAHAVCFAAGIEAAAKYHDNFLMTKTSVAVEKVVASTEAIRALTPPDITAAAARVLLAAWPTDTSFDAAFAACATAYHGGDQMQDTMDRTLATVSAALRALAEVKP